MAARAQYLNIHHWHAAAPRGGHPEARYVEAEGRAHHGWVLLLLPQPELPRRDFQVLSLHPHVVPVAALVLAVVLHRVRMGGSIPAELDPEGPEHLAPSPNNAKLGLTLDVAFPPVVVAERYTNR